MDASHLLFQCYSASSIKRVSMKAFKTKVNTHKCQTSK